MRILAILLIATALPLHGQTATYYWDWTARWNSVRYLLQPVAVDPAVTTPPRTSGLGMGAFRHGVGVVSVFQAKAVDTTNYNGQMGPYYNTNPNYVGDHVDALIRHDIGGSYDRVIDFYKFPPNYQLTTLSDASVKQSPADPLPGNLSNSRSTGLNWQFGAGFAPLIGPRLNNDPLGTARLVAFFSAEAYPTDLGIAGHLIGFASTTVSSSSTTVIHGIPYSSTWKNPASYNDGDSKLARGVPLRTLHLANFTPVVAARGDTGINARWDEAGNLVESSVISGGRYFSGLTSWYTDGYFYLLTSTLLSRYAQDCAERPTSWMLGLLLMRVKADLTGSAGYGGLWLDTLGRPRVELYYSDTKDGMKYFHGLPYPDRVISFSDDDRPWQCVAASRTQFAGCCDNPPVPAANAILLYPNDGGWIGLPSSNFVGYNGCDRYVALSSNNPPTTGNAEVRLLKLADVNGACGAGNPVFAFTDAGRVSIPLPNGYGVDPWYRTILPNVTPYSPTTVLGYRHVVNSSGREGQLPFTAPLSLP